ncbi:pseudouridine synthase [Endozoicomonas montiporae]|uniref:Pseudouridine synthase n=2 Tax=Endozoicomonas montiporae TaxID=1027273 RepID=A0A081N786_9GAMM|nr:RNA pseudouridine synthase [Endozoicomonas montiporae]AMO55866.1 ribosomal large subunit pseudouridine synthase F [Endozoicomonas montiporae CL-33]KEQ14309.1 pseudouridine synthase [Endozoicomonas montiporae]
MIRIAKYIAASGLCSRRAASRLIDSGQVQVNGRAANHIDHVNKHDNIVVNGLTVKAPEERCYYLYNKPVGIDCVCKPQDVSSIIHQINTPVRVFPVGRLDKDSHGLMLLTNDGELCQKLLHPDYVHEKEYRVAVDKPVTDAFLEKMSAGVTYNAGNKLIITRPCRVKRQSDNEFRITLTQGMNRQIRRMCKALGYRVIELQRLRMESLKLGDLPLNQIQNLSEHQVLQLKQTLDSNR